MPDGSPGSDAARAQPAPEARPGQDRGARDRHPPRPPRPRDRDHAGGGRHRRRCGAGLGAADRAHAGGRDPDRLPGHAQPRRDGRSEYLRNPFWAAVEDVRASLTPDLPSTISGHNLAASPQTEVMPELAPGPGDVVITAKHRLSSFLDTDLDSWLRALGTETLLLIGINTNTCVQCAAFEAMNRDYAAVVVSDCVNSMYGRGPARLLARERRPLLRVGADGRRGDRQAGAGRRRGRRLTRVR